MKTIMNMNNYLFEYFTTDNISGKKCTEKWLSKNNILLYNEICDWCNTVDILKNVEFKVKVYHFITELKEFPLCPTCGKQLKYKNIRYGYSHYCNNKCVKNSNDYKEKWKSSWKKNNSDGKSIIKRNETVIKKYGSIEEYNNNLFLSVKDSHLKKHGVEHYFQSEEFKKKRKETLNEKYGNEKYNNPNKTKETRIKNGTQLDDSNIRNFNIFKRVVSNRTLTIYRNNQKFINPNNLNRSHKTYHIDHKFSMKQGYLYNLPIEIMTHPCNLQMIDYMENLIKQDNCSITLNELLNDIINYNKTIKFTNKELKEKYQNVKMVAENILNNI